MEWTIDLKDRAILYNLDQDGRQPISQLAKKVKLNREVVRYRIERMMEDGVIQKFLTCVPVTRLGYLMTTFFMKFQDTSIKDEEGMIKQLTGKKEVVWAASTNGRFDLGFTISAGNMGELAAFIAEFRDSYRSLITDFHMANIVRGWRFPRRYLVDQESEERGKVAEINPSWKNVEKVDKRILAALGEDGRMRAVDIAKRVGISADAVADRINRMRKEKLIAGFSLVLDNNALKRKGFKSFITFHNVRKSEEKFLNYCYEHRNVVQVKRMLGPWEYEVDLELESEEELRDLHSKFKEHFSDSVRSTSFVDIYRVHKFDLGGFLVE